MKPGLTSVTFRGKSIEEVFECASKAGIESIEWGVCDNHIVLGDTERIEKIKELSILHKIGISSLGAYCRMEDMEEAFLNLETAKLLGAPIIRVWAGKKASADCDENYRSLIEKNTAVLAEKAKEYGIKIGFEYHIDSLTDTADSAKKLAEDIAMDNVGLYWQQNSAKSVEENIKDLMLVKPYLVGNIHVHNYTMENGYGPLDDIKENLTKYIKESPYDSTVMIEFVKDGTEENFYKDAKVLRDIINSGRD